MRYKAYTRPRQKHRDLSSATGKQLKALLYMQIAMSLWKKLSPAIKKSYVQIVSGTGYNCKDYFISNVLRRLFATGTTGQILLWIDFDTLPNPNEVSISLTGTMCTKNTGYGDTAWGITPWGTPQEMRTYPGYQLPDYSATFLDNITSPKKEAIP
jgi:hypothetical protein